MFLSIPEHSASIAQILTVVDDAPDWLGVYDWLLITGSVKSVEIDTIQHNYSYGWCGPGDEFDEAREALLEQFVARLTVFGFAWGALESAIDIISPQPHPDKSKRGKIGNACHFLQQAFHRRGNVLGLEGEIEAFRSLAQRCIGYESVEKRFKQAMALGFPGAGLYTVYELRNLFAHGSLSFPWPDSDNRPISDHSYMVKHATRIVLLQIQMLLLAHFKESEEIIEITEGSSPWSTETTLWKALRSCHLIKTEDPNQLTFIEFDSYL